MIRRKGLARTLPEKDSSRHMSNGRQAAFSRPIPLRRRECGTSVSGTEWSSQGRDAGAWIGARTAEATGPSSTCIRAKHRRAQKSLHCTFAASRFARKPHQPAICAPHLGRSRMEWCVWTCTARGCPCDAVPGRVSILWGQTMALLLLLPLRLPEFFSSNHPLHFAWHGDTVDSALYARRDSVHAV